MAWHSILFDASQQSDFVHSLSFDTIAIYDTASLFVTILAQVHEIVVHNCLFSRVIHRVETSHAFQMDENLHQKHSCQELP